MQNIETHSLKSKSNQLTDACRGWAKEEIIDYLKETYCDLSDASESDRQVSEIFL